VVGGRGEDVGVGEGAKERTGKVRSGKNEGSAGGAVPFPLKRVLSEKRENCGTGRGGASEGGGEK